MGFLAPTINSLLQSCSDCVYFVARQAPSEAITMCNVCFYNVFMCQRCSAPLNIGTFTDDTLVAVARRHPSVIHRSIVAVTKYFYNKIFLYFHPAAAAADPRWTQLA